MMAGIHDGDLFDDVDAWTVIQRLAEAAKYATEHPQTLRQFRAG